MGAVFVMILLRCVIAHLNWVVEKCGENQGDATTREGTWGKNNCKQQKRALSIDSRLWMEKIWAFYQHNSRISPDFTLTFYVSSKSLTASIPQLKALWDMAVHYTICLLV